MEVFRLLKNNEVEYATFNGKYNKNIWLDKSLVDTYISGQDEFGADIVEYPLFVIKQGIRYIPDLVKIQAEANTKLQAKYTTAMEDMMDTQAKSRGYDNRYTASIRAGNPNSPFYTEALAFSTWMDTCYSMGYKILADVKAGTRTMPTVDAFLLELPKLVW